MEMGCSLDSTLLVALQICDPFPGYAVRQAGSSPNTWMAVYQEHFAGTLTLLVSTMGKRLLR